MRQFSISIFLCNLVMRMVSAASIVELQCESAHKNCSEYTLQFHSFPDIPHTVPQSFEGYHIVCKLGGGTFGDVYLASTDTNAGYVALKLFRKECRDYERESMFASLFSQATLVLDHSVVGSHKELFRDYFISTLGMPDFKDKQVYVKDTRYFHGLVFEWMPYTLREFSKLPQVQKHLDVYLKVLLWKMLTGLCMTEMLGIVHLDIKPENILCSVSKEFGFDEFSNRYSENKRNGIRYLLDNVRIVLCDLGAMSFVPKAPASEYFDVKYAFRMVKRGMIGTTGYKSPEIPLGQCNDLTTRSDMYSLAQSVLTILNGRSIFSGMAKKNPMLVVALYFRLFNRVPESDSIYAAHLSRILEIDSELDLEDDTVDDMLRFPTNITCAGVESLKYYSEYFDVYSSVFVKRDLEAIQNVNSTVSDATGFVHEQLLKLMKVTGMTKKTMGIDGFRLLKGMLRICAFERITAREAREHKYFDDVVDALV